MLPNIVYILADDMGYGDLGCYDGESRIPTPHMDKIAEEGLRFTDAHAAAAVCTPSRYSILTGRYCWRTPLKEFVFFNYEKPLIEPKRQTVASLLKLSGYETACVGKWHVGLDWQVKPGANIDLNGPWPWFAGPLPDRRVSENIDFAARVGGGPNDLGFDYGYYTSGCAADQEPFCFIEDGYCRHMEEAVYRHPEGSWRSGMTAHDWDNRTVDNVFTEKAVQFIGSHCRRCPDSPFFLYLALSAPHSPHFPPAFVAGSSDAGTRGDLVCLVDWAVGEISRRLDELGISQNTLLIVTSDNGPLPGSTPNPGDPEGTAVVSNGHASAGSLRGYKAMIYEGGHRVPFIARWPEQIRPSSEHAGTVCLTDLFASLADITGTPIETGAAEDSISLLPALTGAKTQRGVPVVHHSGKGVFALRKDRWKLIYETKGDGRSAYPESGSDGQLYDINADLVESSDQWENQRSVREQLTAELKRVIS